MPEDFADVKSKWNIDIQKNPKEMWSFGVCLSHMVDETYIYSTYLDKLIEIE